MKAYIVCEGNRNAEILERVIPNYPTNTVHIVIGGGLYEVKSLARSLIVRRRTPVIIVLDSDTVVLEHIEERLQSTEEIISVVAANTPFKVVLAVPEIEAIFFHDIGLLSRLLGYTPSQEMIGFAVYQPKKALEQLLSKSNKVKSESELLAQLTDEDVDILRQVPFIQEVIQFVQSVQESIVVA
ncbi:MAG: hypothetical protein AAF639_01965 [Chloroflexota bacterium]